MKKSFCVICFINHQTRQFSLSKRVGFPASTLEAMAKKEAERGFEMFVMAKDIDELHAKGLVHNLKHDMQVAGYNYEGREGLEFGPYSR